MNYKTVQNSLENLGLDAFPKSNPPQRAVVRIMWSGDNEHQLELLRRKAEYKCSVMIPNVVPIFTGRIS